ASITGAFVAMVLACESLVTDEKLTKLPISDYLAAISVGVLPEGEVILDLDYEKDFSALVDMNIVMTGAGKFVEIQGTGEEATFTYDELDLMLEQAKYGMEQLFLVQKEVLGDVAERIGENKHQVEEEKQNEHIDYSNEK